MCGPRCVHLCGCAFCVHAFLCPALGVHVPMCFSLYARLCLSLHMCAQSYMCVPVWPQEVGPFGDGRNFLLPHLLPKQEDVCWLRNGLLQQGFTYWVAQEVLVTIWGQLLLCLRILLHGPTTEKQVIPTSGKNSDNLSSPVWRNSAALAPDCPRF